MKNYDETRQILKGLGYRRSDRTGPDGIHEEQWYAPAKRTGRFDNPYPITYKTACFYAGLTPVKTPVSREPKPPYRRKKEFQIKHLDTRKILTFIADFQKRTGQWCLFYDMDRELVGWTDFPQSLRRAKMRRLLAQGLVTGCGCGCRGDFEMTKLGYDFLGSERKRDDIAPGVKATVNGRAVRDLWWEGTTMCIQYDDDGKVAKFRGAYATSYSMSADFKPIDPLNCFDVTPLEPVVDMKATIEYERTIEFIPITFVVTEEKK